MHVDFCAVLISIHSVSVTFLLSVSALVKQAVFLGFQTKWNPIFDIKNYEKFSFLVAKKILNHHPHLSLW